MPKRIWIYLINTFEVNTRGSFIKMNDLASDHDSSLETANDDPVILEMYTPFHAELLIYQGLMVQWRSGKGTGKGNTKSWEGLLDEMAEKWINIWQGMVYATYPFGTPEATAIFPQLKTPFRKTRYAERLIIVETLHATLLTFPVLKPVADAVEVKLTELSASRKTQKKQFTKTNIFSTQLEAQRLVLADFLDDDLCKLKVHYRKQPGMVKNFFDLALLRRAATDVDIVFQHSGTVEAGITTAVAVPAKLTMSANAACTFINNSNVAELQFFFSSNASASDHPNKISVLPNIKVDTTAAEAGWAPGTGFIIIKNTGSVTAEFELVVTEALETTTEE